MLRPTLQSFTRVSSLCAVIVVLAGGFTFPNFCIGHAFAQGFRVERKDAPSMVGGGTFASLQGRFLIALPERHHGFQALRFDTPFGEARGDEYIWKLKEGSFSAGHVDVSQSVEDIETSARVFANIRKIVLASAASHKGKLVSEKRFELQKHPALELRVELPEALTVRRTFLVSRRIYQVAFFLQKEQRTQEAEALRVLDSFKLLSEEEVSAVEKAQATEAEPSPLPQEPVISRVRTDAEDEGLRGNVKTVFEETEDLSGTWSVQGRKPSGKDYYNKLGNLTKKELYDYKGNLFEITVFGYLDVGRVSLRKSIQHEYNPPPIMIGAPPSGGASPKADPRYTNKFTFQYDDKKRLIEKTWFINNGQISIRYVHKYSGNQREELVYSADGSLNQRYLAILDDKGNEVEQTSFETRHGTVRDKYSYAYEFDAKGNWIKQTTSKWVTKDGSAQYVPAYINYRTIVYY